MEDQKADQQVDQQVDQVDQAEADAEEREKRFREHVKKTEAELIFLNCPFC